MTHGEHGRSEQLRRWRLTICTDSSDNFMSKYNSAVFLIEIHGEKEPGAQR